MRAALFGLAFVLYAAVAFAQGATAEVTQNAPIYVRPEVLPAPLRVAATGTKLVVLKEEGQWAQVQFNDPQYGRRAGWVSTAHIRVIRTRPEPMDLSVPEPSATAPVTHSPEVAPASVTTLAPPPSGVAQTNDNVLYITPTEDDFETYLSAAMVKKGVPVTVTRNAKTAGLELRASSVDVQKQSTGSKFARCLFAYCAGIEDRGATSVQLLRGDVVVWSYAVNKGRGQKNQQALAEAVAKHLRSEYFEGRR